MFFLPFAICPKTNIVVNISTLTIVRILTSFYNNNNTLHIQPTWLGSLFLFISQLFPSIPSFFVVHPFHFIHSFFSHTHTFPSFLLRENKTTEKHLRNAEKSPSLNFCQEKRETTIIIIFFLSLHCYQCFHLSCTTENSIHFPHKLVLCLKYISFYFTNTWILLIQEIFPRYFPRSNSQFSWVARLTISTRFLFLFNIIIVVPFPTLCWYLTKCFILFRGKCIYLYLTPATPQIHSELVASVICGWNPFCTLYTLSSPFPTATTTATYSLEKEYREKGQFI